MARAKTGVNKVYTNRPTGDAELALVTENRNKYIKLINEVEGTVFPLKLIEIEDFHFRDLAYIKNQIIVQYKDGTYEVFPPGIVSKRLTGFLGFRRMRVARWGVMPRMTPFINGAYHYDVYPEINFK